MHSLEKDNREVKEEISHLKEENKRIWSNTDSGSHTHCATNMQNAFLATYGTVMTPLAQQDNES